ncbi:lipoprotein-releasing system permease protein [Constrictibacter sp. MBR-5]|jgi:lipoprotein-releasing system permease protein|uniref:lipoprotein-releasing ABC transporter permease subunit n=1 Tax=Constrictibacter sp. MBR-5 TaxID=3156467 RepID=UPI0033996027
MIFSPFERMVAFRYLRARRREGFISLIAWFSLLGIALGVATLIIVMSVMNGFRGELMTRVLGVNGHVSVYSAMGGMTGFDTMADKVRQIDGVVSVTPTVEGQVMVTAGGSASGALVRGLRPEDLAKRKTIAEGVLNGALSQFGEEDGILVGSKLAGRLRVGPGDVLNLVAPQGSISPFGSVPRMRGYRIVGLFEVGMFEYDNSMIFMPMPAAQLFFQLPEAVSNLEVTVADPDEARAVGTAIRQALGPDARVFDWQQSNATFVNALEVERNVMFLILTLIIVVAAFNIISSLIMLVKDKGRDIAVLRAMGATRGMIMRIFFLSGSAVGFAGTIAGFVLGLVFSLNVESIRSALQTLTGTKLFPDEIYFLSRLPAEVDPGEVATVVLMALGLSMLATIFPSRRAAKLHPAEALRYE